MRRKQKWIPLPLVQLAEDMAKHIRRKQEMGELYHFPPNVRGSQLLVMAVALGLRKIAEEVGYEIKERVEEEKSRRRLSDEERSFLEKLLGG